MIKKKLQLKHKDRKVTDKEDEDIRMIALKHSLSYFESKERYFEDEI